jgi:RNA polymerase sigma factor for flagellar operon FliA
MDDILAMWERFKSTGDDGTRDRLIVQYSPLVKFVAGRVGVGLPRNVDQADLVSYGIFGLIDAIDKFEPERGFKFETYAISRIKGAILDELRAMDWVPRSVRARAREIERSMAELEHRMQRTPTDEELASHMGSSVDDLRDALAEISNLGVVALDEVLSPESGTSLGDNLSDPHGLGPEAMHQREETRCRVGRLDLGSLGRPDHDVQSVARARRPRENSVVAAKSRGRSAQLEARLDGHVFALFCRSRRSRGPVAFAVALARSVHDGHRLQGRAGL